MSSSNVSSSSFTAQAQEVDTDLYGRAFDGIFGPGAEQVARREALLRLKQQRDRRFNRSNKNHINRDLYGRGDPRIFGTTALIKTQLLAADARTSKNKTNPSQIKTLHIPAGLMGKLAKLCEQKDLEKKQTGALFPLESLTSSESSVPTSSVNITSYDHLLSPTNVNVPSASKSNSNTDYNIGLVTKAQSPSSHNKPSSSRSLPPGQYHAEDDEIESVHLPAKIDNVPRRIRSRKPGEMDKVSSVGRGRVMLLIGSLEEHGPFSPRHSVRTSASGSMVNSKPDDDTKTLSPEGNIYTTPVTPGLGDSTDSSASATSHTSSRTSSGAPISTSTSSSHDSSFRQNHPSQRPSHNISSSTAPAASSTASSHIPTGPGESSSDDRFASRPESRSGSRSESASKASSKPRNKRKPFLRPRRRNNQPSSKSSSSPSSSSSSSLNATVTASAAKRREGVLDRVRNLFGSSKSSSKSSSATSGKFSSQAAAPTRVLDRSTNSERDREAGRQESLDRSGSEHYSRSRATPGLSSSNDQFSTDESSALGESQSNSEFINSSRSVNVSRSKPPIHPNSRSLRSLPASKLFTKNSSHKTATSEESDKFVTANETADFSSLVQKHKEQEIPTGRNSTRSMGVSTSSSDNESRRFDSDEVMPVARTSSSHSTTLEETGNSQHPQHVAADQENSNRHVTSMNYGMAGRASTAAIEIRAQSTVSTQTDNSASIDSDNIIPSRDEQGSGVASQSSDPEVQSVMQSSAFDSSQSQKQQRTAQLGNNEGNSIAHAKTQMVVDQEGGANINQPPNLTTAPTSSMNNRSQSGVSSHSDRNFVDSDDMVPGESSSSSTENNESAIDEDQQEHSKSEEHVVGQVESDNDAENSSGNGLHFNDNVFTMVESIAINPSEAGVGAVQEQTQSSVGVSSSSDEGVPDSDLSDQAAESSIMETSSSNRGTLSEDQSSFFDSDNSSAAVSSVIVSESDDNEADSDNLSVENEGSRTSSSSGMSSSSQGQTDSDEIESSN